jgi:hypothetical protein
MNDLLVVRTTKTVRLLCSRLKLIAAHMARSERAYPSKIDCAEASAIVVELMAAWEPSPPPPAHKFTRTNDLNGLSALLRDRLRSKARQTHFAPRNETSRMKALNLWNR